MNWRLQLIRLYCPARIKSARLAELFDLTAQAFQQQCPDLNRLSVNERLHQYAMFTKTAAQQALRQPDDLNSIKAQLYQKALQLGQKIRAELHLQAFRDVLLASKILYGILGIDFYGDRSGAIVIRRCFFSQFYSGPICQIISALDEGVAAGLSGGGKLTFYQRITEGKDCCKANLSFKEQRW